jgi:hypothetical protein
MLTILGVYHLSTISERDHGAKWYPQAFESISAIAGAYYLSARTVAGVVAALSPRNKWTRNLIDAEQLIRIYKAAGLEEASQYKVCTFNGNKSKALQILDQDPTDPQRIRDILNGPKLCEFFDCITGNVDEVCIDGHAYSVWAGDRITLDKIPSIGAKLRAKIKSDYTEAARIVKISPSQIQATTWLTWRRLHGL